MGVRHEGVPEESIMAPCSLEHCSKHDRFIHSFVCFENRATITHSIVPIRRWSHQTHTHAHAHTHTQSPAYIHFTSIIIICSFIVHSFLYSLCPCLLCWVPFLFRNSKKKNQKVCGIPNETKPICLTKHSPQEYYTTRARRELDSRILGNLRSQLCVASHTQTHTILYVTLWHNQHLIFCSDTY